MAVGDVTLFNQFSVDLGDKLHNLSTDNIKMGIVGVTVTPTTATADPRWGAGGTTNFLAQEVSPVTGNYATGGPELTVTISDPWSEPVAGTVELDLDDVSIAQHANNPTGAYWGILYNDTDAGKRCIGFIELGTAVDLSAGLFTIAWHANGIYRDS